MPLVEPIFSDLSSDNGFVQIGGFLPRNDCICYPRSAGKKKFAPALNATKMHAFRRVWIDVNTWHSQPDLWFVQFRCMENRPNLNLHSHINLHTRNFTRIQNQKKTLLSHFFSPTYNYDYNDNIYNSICISIYVYDVYIMYSFIIFCIERYKIYTTTAQQKCHEQNANDKKMTWQNKTNTPYFII